MAYHGTYTWNILTGCLICLNHKDFTYSPVTSLTLLRFFHVFSKGFGVTEKSPFVLLRTLNRCKPLDQASFGRTRSKNNGWISRGFPGYPTNLGFTSHLRSLSLIDWGFSKNSYGIHETESASKNELYVAAKMTEMGKRMRLGQFWHTRVIWCNMILTWCYLFRQNSKCS